MLLRLSNFVRRSGWLIVLSALLWLILTANEGWAFFVGLLLLILVWQWHYPLMAPKFQWRYFPALFLTFMRQLWFGGIDVARRAFFGRTFKHAGFSSYTCRLTQPAQQQIFATLVSLLPGTCTVSVSAADDTEQAATTNVSLLLHVLDQTANWHAEVAELEWQLARFMASPLSKEDTP